MENQNAKQLAEKITKEVVRNGDLEKGKNVLEMLPDVVGTVCIDQKKLRHSIEQCVSTNNPVNAFLSVFGFQMISKNKVNTMIDDSDLKIDDSFTNKWVKIDQKKFKDIAEKISAELYNAENEDRKAYDEEEQRRKDLFDKCEELTKERDELINRVETSERMVAERIQYILANNGKEAAAENEQLIEILKDLDIDVYWDSWDSEEAPLTYSAMFTENKTGNETLANTVKPCLVKNGSVFVKGIKFMKA